jgi:HKD family nuclease
VGDWDLVPGPRLQSPAQAIRELWESSYSVSAAVAFVTSSGVRDLMDLVRTDLSRLELTARAAPVTEPNALLELEEAGARVFGVAGAWAPAFHPKLWLGHTSDRLLVLSGSANLTTPALRKNKEQMELLRVAADSEAADAHTERFRQLTAARLSLADLTARPIGNAGRPSRPNSPGSFENSRTLLPSSPNHRDYRTHGTRRSVWHFSAICRRPSTLGFLWVVVGPGSHSERSTKSTTQMTRNLCRCSRGSSRKPSSASAGSSSMERTTCCSSDWCSMRARSSTAL